MGSFKINPTPTIVERYEEGYSGGTICIAPYILQSPIGTTRRARPYSNAMLLTGENASSQFASFVQSAFNGDLWPMMHSILNSVIHPNIDLNSPETENIVFAWATSLSNWMSGGRDAVRMAVIQNPICQPYIERWDYWVDVNFTHFTKILKAYEHRAFSSAAHTTANFAAMMNDRREEEIVNPPDVSEGSMRPSIGSPMWVHSMRGCYYDTKIIVCSFAHDGTDSQRNKYRCDVNRNELNNWMARFPELCENVKGPVSGSYIVPAIEFVAEFGNEQIPWLWWDGLIVDLNVGDNIPSPQPDPQLNPQPSVHTSQWTPHSINQ